jgi:integrase
MRHAFGDHIAKNLGLYAAQGLMRHSSVRTTEGYVGKVSLDDMARTVSHLSLFGATGGGNRQNLADSAP